MFANENGKITGNWNSKQTIHRCWGAAVAARIAITHKDERLNDRTLKVHMATTTATMTTTMKKEQQMEFDVNEQKNIPTITRIEFAEIKDGWLRV